MHEFGEDLRRAILGGEHGVFSHIGGELFMNSCFDAFTDIETNFHGFFRELAHFNSILDGELVSVSSRDSLFSQAINYILKLNFRH